MNNAAIRLTGARSCMAMPPQGARALHGGTVMNVPRPTNEPNMINNEAQRKATLCKVAELRKGKLDIPLIINGKEVRTGNTGEIRPPHDRHQLLGTYHKAGEKEVKEAIEGALDAHKHWRNLPSNQRIAVFMKMASLLSTKYRALLAASTLLGQGKNLFQAEIDTPCEAIDFLTYNAYYAQEIYNEQPASEHIDPYGRGAVRAWNRVEYRPLEGFLYAISPFNFTAIALNLATAPAMLGNTVVWKPSDHAILSNYYLTELYREAGLPAGVINFIPGDPELVTKVILDNPKLAGIHYTGSTAVFRSIFKSLGTNIDRYANYPRLVGETGGKNFVIAHSSANVDAVVTALLRGAYEFSGQKCSAASRAYVPASMWNEMRSKLIEGINSFKVGNPEELDTMVGPVIHKASFDRCKSMIDHAKADSKTYTIHAGGKCDDSKGYFVFPTLIETKDPHALLMEKEIFGPILTVYVFPDNQIDDALRLAEQSAYGLTGAIFANDRYFIEKAMGILEFGCGNLYINDKPTGAVVGQQPFGGSRASGTNDKAGAKHNLLRFLNMRSIKENLIPDTTPFYPYMSSKE